MKKIYSRPLAEVIEITAQDIITASSFAQKVDGSLTGGHLVILEDGSLSTGITTSGGASIITLK